MLTDKRCWVAVQQTDWYSESATVGVVSGAGGGWVTEGGDRDG